MGKVLLKKFSPVLNYTEISISISIKLITGYFKYNIGLGINSVYVVIEQDNSSIICVY